MVKKYKLTNSNIKEQKAGAGVSFVYPVAPGFAQATPQIVAPNIMMGWPYMAGNNGSYIRTDRNGDLKLGMPLVNTNGNGINMVIPPRFDTRDPSVFVGVDASATKSKPSGPIKNVNLTFKEAMPKQSIVSFQPNLPIIPNSFGIQMPTIMQPTAPILINPTESKARMEISSNESDDIMTISGEQEKIKPIYDGIKNENKVKIAQNEVTQAKTALKEAESKTPPTLINYETTYKPLTLEELEKKDATALPVNVRTEVIRLKKAQMALQKAKKEAKLADNDTDVPETDLISLAELFDLPKVINEIKTKYKLLDTDFQAQPSKKNNLQLLLGLGLPYNYGLYNGVNYGVNYGVKHGINYRPTSYYGF